MKWHSSYIVTIEHGLYYTFLWQAVYKGGLHRKSRFLCRILKCMTFCIMSVQGQEGDKVRLKPWGLELSRADVQTPPWFDYRRCWMNGCVIAKRAWPASWTQNPPYKTNGNWGHIKWRTFRSLGINVKQVALLYIQTHNTDLGHVLLVVRFGSGRQMLAKNPIAAGVVVLALKWWTDTLEVELHNSFGKRESS